MWMNEWVEDWMKYEEFFYISASNELKPKYTGVLKMH